MREKRGKGGKEGGKGRGKNSFSIKFPKCLISGVDFISDFGFAFGISRIKVE